jgi:glycosyltransferase involved in cell wall biosynthesis
MAVNIANGLLPIVEGSHLCSTRQEGLLKEQLKPEVGFVFLEKKSSLDIRAVSKLRNYIKENNITIVHAHSTSYFLAGLIKLSGGNFKLIWHDHYGESDFLEKRQFKVLKKFSCLFSGIISVNSALKNWAVAKLNCKNVVIIRNFIPKFEKTRFSNIKLKGNITDFKIICVANLRPQKDHLNLLRAFELFDPTLDVSLHLIGEDPKTSYSTSILKELENSPVSHKIHYYGIQSEIIALLQQADLGVLSSRSEGLPLALLEYGIAGLPVVCTNVGQCAAVINNFGKIVEKENSKMLYEGISAYLDDSLKMKEEAKLYQQEVKNQYSEKEMLRKYLNFIGSDI